MIGIDFTGSNGYYTDPNSLHYLGGEIPNPYQQAIEAVVPIVAPYDYDQSFACYGYGAYVDNKFPPWFCINLTDNVDYLTKTLTNSA